MAHDVFISYSSIDKTAADAVCSIMEQNGIPCWMAPRDIMPGKAFSEAIIDAIQNSKVFVLVYSSNSNHSAQVIKEVDRAVHHGLSIINLRLNEEPLSKKLEYYISDVHWMDATTSPLEPHLNKLLNVVQTLLKPEEVKDTEIAEALRKGIIKQNESSRTGKGSRMARRRNILVSGIIGAVVILTTLVVFNIGGLRQARAGSIGSIIVLPFENYTGMDSLEYFVSGMHSALIQDMGKIGSIRIPGTTTSKFYKNANKTIEQITKETNVDAALETDVLCLGNDSICFQIRLVKPGRKEEQLWIADYKIPRNQILNWYNGVTKQIAKEINIELTLEEERLLSKFRTVDREAYDAYLMSYQHWDDLSEESLNKALEYLNLAVEKDPDFAPLYGGLATVWAGLAQLGFVAPDVAMTKIYENLDKATELDPDYPGSHYTKAVVGVWLEWDWEKGEREFKKALEINPNDAMSRIYYAHLLWILKRHDEAYFHSQMAAELDPMNPLVLALSAMVDEHGRIQQSLEKSRKALEIDPEHYFALLAYAEATYFNGDYKNSIETELKTWPGLDDDAREDIMSVFQDKGYVEAIRTMLTYVEEYAKTNYIINFDMGEYYWRAGNLDKSIEWYIKAYEMHEQMMPYITLSEVGFDDIKDDPRIIAIVKEMNLPFETPD